MLEASDLSYSYGEAHALIDVSVSVDESELVVVLGSNGAGKSTLLNCIIGLLRPREGSVSFKDEDITGTSPNEVWQRGLVLVPEDRKLFTNMTVAENLELGTSREMSDTEKAERLDEVTQLFPILDERREQKTGTLSGGQQQQLAIGRGLMRSPEMLLLDEPTLGLAPDLSRDALDTIAQINSRGTTILLVSQKASQSLRIADRGYVLENGEVVMSDSSEKLVNDDRIRKAYLGL